MESCVYPNNSFNRPSIRRQTNESRASRLTVRLVKQSSHHSGNISVIKVNIKTINQIANLLPLENDTLKSVRERLINCIEKSQGYKMTEQIKENFSFQLEKGLITREDELLGLDEFLKKRWEGSENVFEGDVLNVNFFLTDIDFEYQMIRDNIEKLKSSSVGVIYIVKQYRNEKNKIKNRLLKIEENGENCLVTLSNIRGDLKEAYPIENLERETKPVEKIMNMVYYPLALSKNMEYQNERGNPDLCGETIYFITEQELKDFLSNIETIKQELQKDSEEDEEEDHLIESIQALGTGEENLDEEVQVGRITSHKVKLPSKEARLSYPGTKSSLSMKPELPKMGDDESRITMMMTSEASPKLKDMNFLGKRDNRGSVFAKLGTNMNLTSMLAKAMNEKKELELGNQEFEVKLKGLLGMSSKRILRLTDDFEFHFFKKEKEKLMFTDSIPWSNLAKADVKKTGSYKVYFFLKTDKKMQKPLKLVFQNTEEANRFLQLSIKMGELFKTCQNSYQTEKARSHGQKQYPWLMGPKDAVTNIQYEQGKPVTIQFNVISMSKSHEPQIAHLDLMNSILSLKSVNGTVKKKLNIRNVLYCETHFKDPRRLTMLLKNKKYKLLFSDCKSRILFELAVYNTTFPQYKIPSKQSFDWETISVFCTTFNAGFGPPPVDLDPWLGKTNDCDVIAIGMQEADTAEWLQAIQEYYLSERFNLVSIVTMWKMLLVVFVSSKYSSYVTNVETDTKATGIAKVIGNKGGVALSFKIMETSFCFLSCHLAAQPERMPTRKANFYNLLKSIRMGDNSVEICGLFDYFFFMGDTNFRLDCNATTPSSLSLMIFLDDFFKAVDVIDKGEHVSLLPNDQYRKARDTDNFMTIFSEGKITFKPTYRRNREDTGYSNKRNQAPSWTDRIFTKSRPGHPASIREYNSAEMFFLSDHRPVYGIYKCEVQPPYLPRTPLYSRPADQTGIIKFSDLELEYDFNLYGKMSEFEGPLDFPLKVSVEFRAQFLHKAAATMSHNIKGIPSSNLSWSEEMLPLLHCVIPDYRFLRNESLLALVKFSWKQDSDSESVCGQADIPLENLIVDSGKKTQFSSMVYFYGRLFGELKGNLIYDLA